MINAERALRNGFRLVELDGLVFVVIGYQAARDEFGHILRTDDGGPIAGAPMLLPEMGCDDCLSTETPYFYSGEGVGVLQEHQDLCPRWAIASEHDAIELDQLYANEERGGVWTGEDLIKARMADPYLFLKKAKAAL